MTAAKVMDIISGLPGCAGQAADAVSACTQVKMENAPKLLKIPKSECPDIWIRLPRHKWPKSWVQYGRPSRSSWTKRNLYGHPLAGLLWEKQLEKIQLKHGWEKSFQLRMLIRTSWKRIIIVCVCGWHQIDWNETKYWPHVESTKERSWFRRTDVIPWSCIPGVYPKTMWNKRGYCGQLQNHVWVQNFRRSNGKISRLGKTDYLFAVLWHGRSCQEVCGMLLWVDKQDDSTTLQSIITMPFTTTTLKKKNWNPWENCQKCALKLFWNACIWHVWEDLIFYGQSTNLHERSQIGSQACDKRLSRLISHIHCTSEYKQYCHLGNTAQQCRLGLFQDSDFAGDIEDSKSTSGGTLCIFGSHTYVPISWMCKKQTSVSHSSTESEFISLDAGLRVDDIPALDLWDLIVTILHRNSNQSKQVLGRPVYISNADTFSWKACWSE